MLTLVNGMDAVNSPDWMLVLVNVMDAVHYKQHKNFTVWCGYQILLSNGMDAVQSPNLMDGKE